MVGGIWYLNIRILQLMVSGSLYIRPKNQDVRSSCLHYLIPDSTYTIPYDTLLSYLIPCYTTSYYSMVVYRVEILPGSWCWPETGPQYGPSPSLKGPLCCRWFILVSDSANQVLAEERLDTAICAGGLAQDSHTIGFLFGSELVVRRYVPHQVCAIQQRLFTLSPRLHAGIIMETSRSISTTRALIGAARSSSDPYLPT